ncbi:unnamed protein product, partial [Ectocarpus sp. 12 AP-2014]
MSIKPPPPPPPPAPAPAIIGAIKESRSAAANTSGGAPFRLSSMLPTPMSPPAPAPPPRGSPASPPGCCCKVGISSIPGWTVVAMLPWDWPRAPPAGKEAEALAEEQLPWLHCCPERHCWLPARLLPKKLLMALPGEACSGVRWFVQ